MHETRLCASCVYRIYMHVRCGMDDVFLVNMNIVLNRIKSRAHVHAAGYRINIVIYLVIYIVYITKVEECMRVCVYAYILFIICTYILCTYIYMVRVCVRARV